MRKFRSALMRGGVGRGLFFHKGDLPPNRKDWESIILQGIGGPDPKQLDGVGGTASSNSKAMIVWPSKLPGIDVEYYASQVDVGKPSVNFNANCGNLTGAVGLFAVEEGLVKGEDPKTKVVAYNHNTNKVIEVEIPTTGGVPDEEGDFYLPGIDGTWPEITMRYIDPAGTVTGKLYPSGNPVDVLKIAGFGDIEATLIDASNPLVLIRGADVGVEGTELPDQLHAMKGLDKLLEDIRCEGCVRMGLAKDHADAIENYSNMPFLAMYHPPRTYKGIGDVFCREDEMDLSIRIVSVRLHNKAHPIVVANAIAAACVLPDTIVSRQMPHLLSAEVLRFGHPSGIMTVYPRVSIANGIRHVESISMGSCARRIMDGALYVRR
jgi:2-methylaconitate cis-trans-isomerase PrpF